MCIYDSTVHIYLLCAYIPPLCICKYPSFFIGSWIDCPVFSALSLTSTEIMPYFYSLRICTQMLCPFTTQEHQSRALLLLPDTSCAFFGLIIIGQKDAITLPAIQSASWGARLTDHTQSWLLHSKCEAYVICPLTHVLVGLSLVLA